MPSYNSFLLQSYLVGLWFSLRTHASQIWQNPQQLLHPQESGRMSLYQKIVPPSNFIPGVSKPPSQRDGSTARPRPSFVGAGEDGANAGPTSVATAPQPDSFAPADPSAATSSSVPSGLQRVSYPNPPVSPTPGSLVPILESVDHALKDTGLRPGQLPSDDFTRAVAVATVSALRHQQVQARRVRSGQLGGDDEDPAGHGGHDAPSWSRAVSASVLLACTALYAVIAGGCLSYIIIVLLIGAHRATCRCCGRRAEWIRDRRKVSRNHAIRARAQHDRVHERDVVCHERQHCP